MPEFVRPLASLFHPQQYFAGIRFNGPGRNIFAGAADHAGNLSKGQAIFAQPLLGDFHVGHVVRCIAQLHLCDGGVGEQTVAQLFRQFPEGPDIDRTVQHDIHDLPARRHQVDFRLLGIIRERADAVYRLVDILERLHPVSPANQFYLDRPATLRVPWR